MYTSTQSSAVGSDELCPCRKHFLLQPRRGHCPKYGIYTSSKACFEMRPRNVRRGDVIPRDVLAETRRVARNVRKHFIHNFAHQVLQYVPGIIQGVSHNTHCMNISLFRGNASSIFAVVSRGLTRTSPPISHFPRHIQPTSLYPPAKKFSGTKLFIT